MEYLIMPKCQLGRFWIHMTIQFLVIMQQGNVKAKARANLPTYVSFMQYAFLLDR